MERMLGNWYNAEEDFQHKHQDGVQTLRQLVSAFATIFDSLGLLVSIVIVGKMLIQRAWKKKTKWDEQLPEDILQDWKRWNGSLLACNFREITPPVKKMKCSDNYTFSATHQKRPLEQLPTCALSTRALLKSAL